MGQSNIGKWIFLLVFITVIALAVIALLGVGDITRGDAELFMILNPGQANPTPYDTFFVVFSTWGPLNLGLGIYAAIISIVFILILSVQITQFRPMRVGILIIIISSIVGLGLVNVLLGLNFSRPRPFFDPLLFSNAQDLFSDPALLFGVWGFPSNHATVGFIVATAIMLVYRSLVVRAVALVYALLEAYSRVFIGVHFPLDVLVGGIVGILTVIIFYLVFKKYLIKQRIICDLKELEE